MLIPKILIHPDIRLRIKASKINNFNNKIKNIIKNMLKVMYINKGIGLAATQINIHKKIIVIDISKDQTKPIILINPKIIKKYGTISIKEGCLSIPNIKISINRYKYIKINTMNCNGKTYKINAHDLLSICIQHEIDHLNGKLILDYKKKIKDINYYIKY
ncbi:peptide deformylase [Candidatus Purcelliella pentastirinorum]|nr:peptide deformylase [Candidatus Purcelliella pentastirinorum]WDR80386.1 peptide deformylase [Candidatus Purcelliella pentastirinorum]